MNEIDQALDEISERRGLEVQIEWQHVESPVTLPLQMQEAVSQACTSLGFPVKKMPSRASHDAARLAPIFPAGVIFIRCKEGRSHASEEWASLEDIADGARVLAQSLLNLDSKAT